MTWFVFSLTATVLFGVAMAFYKFPSVKEYSRFATAFWVLFVSFILAVLFFYAHLPTTTDQMLFLALLWGVSFPSIMLLQMYALEHVDTTVLFPLTGTVSMALTVLLGIFVFDDVVSLLQTLGVVLAVIIVFLYSYKGGKPQFARLVVGVGSMIIFVSVFNKVLQKIVADSVNIFAFQIYQYVFASLVTLGILLFVHKRTALQELFSGSFKPGALIGIFSFFGGYSFYLALTEGPFSLITAIHSFYIFATALTAYLLFREEITTRRILLMALAIVAVLLIRLG